MVHIDCSLILVLLTGILALLKIGGQFPYSWLWVFAPVWIPFGIILIMMVIMLLAWLIGIIGVLISERFIRRMAFRASQRSRIGGQLAANRVKRN